MESTAYTEGTFSTSPWVPVNIGDSKLLIKAWFGDVQYHLLLSDLNSVWEEEMSKTSIEKRAQVLNKRLRAPVQTFFAHLRSVALPCLSSQSYDQSIAVEHQGSQLTIRLKSELGNVPFYWEFHCTPASVALVSRELVCPLLSMTRMLHGHVGDLTALLLRKDAEIQDYKENGAVLSKGRLQTEPFEEETWKRNNQKLKMMQDSFEFGAELQELYVSVCTARNNKKRKCSGTSSVPDQDQNSCVPAGMRPDVLWSNRNSTEERGEDTSHAEIKETVRCSPVAAAAVTPTDRPVIHPKKKKTAGLFQ